MSLNDRVTSVSHFLHRRLLWLLIASYAIAAVWPALGLGMRNASLWHMRLFRESSAISVPMLLLAFLLFSAGLGVREMPSRSWLRKGTLLGCGTVGNFLFPLLFILGVSQLMPLWHNGDEMQNILVGLALIASMPIAGSSTAWAQNAEGDMSVSLGLVLFSTFLSPLTTPAVLHAVGFLTTGDYSAELHNLARYGTETFLMLFVLVPSLAGLGLRAAAGKRRVDACKPCLRVANTIVLLLLSYSNAAVSLPQVLAQPDLDLLVLILAMVISLCALAFGAGWLVARFAKSDRDGEASLMFGLGMNNNGTGLVLASATLAHRPLVMVPIILYNLVQHLAAGAVDRLRYTGPKPGRRFSACEAPATAPAAAGGD